MWLDRKGKRRAAEGIEGRQLRLVSPWEVSIGCPALITSLAGWKLVSYKESIEIHRYLEGTGGKGFEMSRELKAYSYIGSKGRGENGEEV